MTENFQNMNIDQEFWGDFTVEAFEHIEEIESNVISLEQNPQDMEIIHTMFRAFHTIKGLSGFVEHFVIQELAHKTETMMDFCRKGELKVNTQIVNAILKSSDYIKRLCEDLSSYKDASFIEQIKNHLVVVEGISDSVGKADSEPEKVTQQAVEEEKLPEAETKEAEQEPVQKEDSGLEAFAQELSVMFDEEPSEQKPVDTKKEKTKNKKEKAEAPKTVEKEGKEVVKEKKAEVFQEPKLPEAQKQEQEVLEKPIPVVPEVLLEIKKEVNEEPVKTIISSNEEYMKVANSKIDNLVEIIGELIINQAQIEQYISDNYSHDNQLISNMSGFLRITRELQNLSMSLRLVSLKPTYQKLVRIARDTIQELGKDVEFVTSGDGTEIDRVVADKLLEPLVHMIKNAISHGIEEDAQDRIKLKKNKKARVELNAYNKRGKIFIEVKDDGRGINPEIVYKKALEKGLIDPNYSYTEEEIKEFILLPGFSTAKVVDNISGRGVGMDVVKTQILKIGGKIVIESEIDKGSVFTLEVPVNHAIMNGTVIDVLGEQFIVPTINVKEILQPENNQWIFTQQKLTMIKVRENIIPIIPTSMFMKNNTFDDGIPLVMILELDQELKALPITNVINRQEVVVKPVGEEFANLKFISGMSILGNGKVSLILDVDYLFKKEVKE